MCRAQLVRQPTALDVAALSAIRAGQSATSGSATAAELAATAAEHLARTVSPDSPLLAVTHMTVEWLVADAARIPKCVMVARNHLRAAVDHARAGDVAKTGECARAAAVRFREVARALGHVEAFAI